MENILVSAFLKILNMSITGGYIILAVMLARLILRAAPKKYSYALWAVALFRLVCPVSFKSVISVFALRPFDIKLEDTTLSSQTAQIVHIPENIGMMTQPEIQTGISAVDAAVNESLPVATPMYSANPLQIWEFVGMLLWLAGIAVLLFISLIGLWRLCRRLRTATLLEGNVWQSENVQSPFIIGFFKPKIYIPYGLEGAALGYVLAHERAHIKRGDHIIRTLAYLVLCLHWFNPLVWLAFWLAGRDMELSCDEKVLGRMGGRAEYSETLLSFASPRRFPAPTPLAFSESSVGRRIKNALKWKRPRLWVSAIALVLCAVVIVACAANPEAEDDGWELAGRWVPVECVYQSPEYSYFPVGGDNGYIYEIHEYGDGLRIIDQQSGKWRGGYAPVGEWKWQKFPYSDAEWESLFVLYESTFSQPISSLYDEILYMPLIGNDTGEPIDLSEAEVDCFLLGLDGELWFVSTTKDSKEKRWVSSIYALQKEEIKGRELSGRWVAVERICTDGLSPVYLSSVNDNVYEFHQEGDGLRIIDRLSGERQRDYALSGVWEEFPYTDEEWAKLSEMLSVMYGTTFYKPLSETYEEILYMPLIGNDTGEPIVISEADTDCFLLRVDGELWFVTTEKDSGGTQYIRDIFALQKEEELGKAEFVYSDGTSNEPGMKIEFSEGVESVYAFCSNGAVAMYMQGELFAWADGSMTVPGVDSIFWTPVQRDNNYQRPESDGIAESDFIRLVVHFSDQSSIMCSIYVECTEGVYTFRPVGRGVYIEQKGEGKAILSFDRSYAHPNSVNADTTGDVPDGSPWEPLAETTAVEGDYDILGGKAEDVTGIELVLPERNVILGEELVVLALEVFSQGESSTEVYVADGEAIDNINYALKVNYADGSSELLYIDTQEDSFNRYTQSSDGRGDSIRMSLACSELWTLLKEQAGIVERDDLPELIIGFVNNSDTEAKKLEICLGSGESSSYSAISSITRGGNTSSANIKPMEKGEEYFANFSAESLGVVAEYDVIRIDFVLDGTEIGSYTFDRSKIWGGYLSCELRSDGVFTVHARGPNSVSFAYDLAKNSSLQLDFGEWDSLELTYDGGTMMFTSDAVGWGDFAGSRVFFEDEDIFWSPMDPVYDENVPAKHTDSAVVVFAFSRDGTTYGGALSIKGENGLYTVSAMSEAINLGLGSDGRVVVIWD